MKLPVPNDIPDPELSRLLDAWQPRPAWRQDFEPQLWRRIAAAEAAATRWPGRLGQLRWQPFTGAVVLTALVAMVLVSTTVRRPALPAPTPAPAAVALAPSGASAGSVVQDLQTWNQDTALLNNLDFLSAPSPDPDAPLAPDGGADRD